jgi:radical SAM superfamily enzyme YgiQ (UPF0313 family)
VRATQGCPYRCTYCAAHVLSGTYQRRPVTAVLDELSQLIHEQDCCHVAFHDDALLGGASSFGARRTKAGCSLASSIDAASPFLELAAGIQERGLHRKARFYSINGLNAAALTDEVAQALFDSNFCALRIGFETADRALQTSTGGKTSGEELGQALSCLYSAGFTPRDVGVYVLAGLPDQEADTVLETLRFVHSVGGIIRVSEFAPVPRTRAFDRARQLSRLDLDEPLHHNKSLAPFRFETLTLEQLREIKDRARILNEGLLQEAR